MLSVLIDVRNLMTPTYFWKEDCPPDYNKSATSIGKTSFFLRVKLKKSWAGFQGTN